MATSDLKDMKPVRRIQQATFPGFRRGHARVFGQFIDEILEGRSHEALREAMSRASQALGLHSFAYINIAPRSQVEPTLISTR